MRCLLNYQILGCIRTMKHKRVFEYLEVNRLRRTVRIENSITDNTKGWIVLVFIQPNSLEHFLCYLIFRRSQRYSMLSVTACHKKTTDSKQQKSVSKNIFAHQSNNSASFNDDALRSFSDVSTSFVSIGHSM